MLIAGPVYSFDLSLATGVGAVTFSTLIFESDPTPGR